MDFSTIAIHGGQHPDPLTGAIMPPVYMTSTYVQEYPAKHKGYEYSRTDNPTRTALQDNLAALEGGAHALCFSSGLAATTAVLNLLKSGDHVVGGNDLYGGTYRLFMRVFQKFGLEFTFVDSADPDRIQAAMRANTKLLWLESPSNPLLRITDIAAACAIARDRGVMTAVDNTFATPYLQRPLDLGADIVVHSATKYLGGHSDVVLGAMVTRNDELHQQLKFYQNAVGGTPGPMDCFLVLRGAKTLAVRMREHCGNARTIARYLSEHPKVARVYYPGLESHAGHAVAKRQMRDFGGMMSMEIKADLEAAKAFTARTRLFSLAESLGGVESLIEHPPSMTHASIPREERLKAGLADGLIRLSVGIEGVDDLIADLDQALEAV